MSKNLCLQSINLPGEIENCAIAFMCKEKTEEKKPLLHFIVCPLKITDYKGTSQLF